MLEMGQAPPRALLQRSEHLVMPLFLQLSRGPPKQSALEAGPLGRLILLKRFHQPKIVMAGNTKELHPRESGEKEGRDESSEVFFQ